MFTKLISYFLRGLLVVVPLLATVYLLYRFFLWFDALLPIEARYPGVGALIIVLAVTIIGFLASTLVARKLVELIELLFNRLPLVGLIYSSLKDMLTAFVGDKRKFDTPVLVRINQEGISRIGFVTQKDFLASHDNSDMLVGVYLPHSYNFSGNFYLVPSQLISSLDLSATEAMKLVVSGGAIEMK